MWRKRTASVTPLSHTKASYHPVCFQSPNINPLFCMLLPLVFSIQRTIASKASPYSKSLCICVSNRTRQIWNSNGKTSIGAWLISSGLAKGKSSFKHLSHYTASTQHCGKYTIKIPFSQMSRAFKTVKQNSAYREVFGLVLNLKVSDKWCQVTEKGAMIINETFKKIKDCQIQKPFIISKTNTSIEKMRECEFPWEFPDLFFLGPFKNHSLLENTVVYP